MDAEYHRDIPVFEGGGKLFGLFPIEHCELKPVGRGFLLVGLAVVNPEHFHRHFHELDQMLPLNVGKYFLEAVLCGVHVVLAFVNRVVWPLELLNVVDSRFVELCGVVRL